MSDSSSRKFDIIVDATYGGAGAMRLALADIHRIREQAELPIVGPLNKDQSATEAIAIQNERVSRIVNAKAKAMLQAGERSRISEIADEQLYGKSTTEQQAKTKARIQEKLAAQAEMMKELSQARVRGVQEYEKVDAAVHDNLAQQRARKDAVRDKELANPEREGKYAAAERMSRGITPQMTEELERAQGKGSGLLGILDKLGLSQGPVRLAKNLAALAPHIGVVAAVAKAATIALDAWELHDDMARHAAQGNIERQAADEKKMNEMATSTPIIGAFGAAIGRRFNVNNIKKDQIAIEELEDATKLQNQEMARQQTTADILKQARLSARNANVAMENQIEGHLKTPEQQAVLAAKSQLASIKREIGELPGFNQEMSVDKLLSSKNLPDESKDMLRNQRKIVDLAVQDEARTHSQRMRLIESETSAILLNVQKDYLGARHVALAQAMKSEINQTLDTREKVAVAWKGIIKLGATFYEEFVDKNKFINRAGAEADEMLLSFSGHKFEAEQKRKQRELNEATSEENDPDKRTAMRKKAAADEHIDNVQDFRDKAIALEDHQHRVEQLESSFRERALRLEGNNFAADKEALAARRSERLAEITRQQREDLKNHAGWADQINQAADEDRANAGLEFEIGLNEAQQRIAKQYAAHPTNQAPTGDSHLLTGVGSQIKEGAQIDQLIKTMNQLMARLIHGQVLLVPGAN